MTDPNETLLVGDATVRHPKTFDTRSTLSEVVTLFTDDHVHMALVVDDDRRLITTVERSDLPHHASPSTPLTSLGMLRGRTVLPESSLTEATAALHRTGRRRLAVVDDRGRLVGLLCLKKSRADYCSDEGIAARARDHQ